MKKKIDVFQFVPFYALVFLGCLVVTVFGSRTATTMSESAPLKGRRCIVVDAGHGGVDGGATSCTGVLESKLNLEISLRLNDLFNLLGYETYMIRTEDISIYTQGETIAAKKISDLKERVRIINQMENPLLLSIHQNHFSDSRYYGAQIFYDNNGTGEQLAKQLQTSFRTYLTPENKRSAKKADSIYIMEHINCNGILIECGFLSNIEEEAKLRSGDYQKKLVCVIAATVANYLDCQTNG